MAAVLLLVIAIAITIWDREPKVPPNQAEQNAPVEIPNEGFLTVLKNLFSAAVPKKSRWNEYCGKPFASVVDQVADAQTPSGALLVENFHFDDGTGREVRAHFTANQGESGNGFEVKYFGLDAEGLPQRIDPPEGFAELTVDQVRQKIKSDYNVKLHSAAGEMVLKDGRMMTYQKSNDEFTSIEISRVAGSEDPTLICRSGEICHCQ